jgi:hypothetical protein
LYARYGQVPVFENDYSQAVVEAFDRGVTQIEVRKGGVGARTERQQERKQFVAEPGSHADFSVFAYSRLKPLLRTAKIPRDAKRDNSHSIVK